MKAGLGEIWLIAIPVLKVLDNGTFDTGFQIRPYLIVDEGKGLLVEENDDYLATKITTSETNKKSRPIDNWQQLGLKEESFVRIEIPDRVEEQQLIKFIAKMPQDQLVNFYKDIASLFNLEALDIFVNQ